MKLYQAFLTNGTSTSTVCIGVKLTENRPRLDSNCFTVMTVVGHLCVRLTDPRVLYIRGERGTEIIISFSLGVLFSGRRHSLCERFRVRSLVSPIGLAFS